MKIEITKGGDNPVAEFFSSPSKTPETDACAKSIDQSNFEDSWKDDFEEFAWVPADFARQLERERNEAREVASGLAMQEERVNEAQKELSSIHRWIERNHPDGFIDSLTYFQNLERVTDNWYDRLDRLEIDANRFERERDEAIFSKNTSAADFLKQIGQITLCKDVAREKILIAEKERDETRKQFVDFLNKTENYKRERDEAMEVADGGLIALERAIKYIPESSRISFEDALWRLRKKLEEENK
jgi:hypothetical protein